MSENVTRFNQSDGPISTGSGPQFNGSTIENMIVVLGLDNPGAWQNGDAAHWTADHLIWLQQRFEHPPGFFEAHRIIEEQGNAVLLVGRPGTGRHATALSLLIGEQSPHDARIRMLSRWSDRANDKPWISEVITPGEGLLLDLTDVPDDSYEQACSAIHGLLGLVADNDARLVIIDDQRPVLHTDLERIRAVIDWPDVRAALWKYLKTEGLWSSGLVISAEHAGYLASKPMRVFPRIMTLVKQSLREEPGDVAKSIDRAFETLMFGEGSLNGLLAKISDVPRRTLLLTGAMFNGLPADSVYLAYIDLLKRLLPGEAGPAGLAAAGFLEQLSTCGIEVGDDEVRRIRFVQLDLDARVLKYFWDNYPELRGPLVQWVCWAAAQRMVSVPDRARIVSRFAAESLRTNRIGDLMSVVSAQMGKASAGSRELVYLMLAAGLDSGHHGYQFRRYLRREAESAARATRLSPGSAQLLIDLCVNHVAPNYPDQAVVRLHWFCAAVDERTGKYARGALLDVVRRDERALRWLVRRIAEGRGGNRHGNADLFAAATCPDRVPDSSLPRIPDADLVFGWRMVIDADSTPVLAGHLDSWLRFCLHQDGTEGAPGSARKGDRALRILANAASHSFPLQSRLEAAATAWATTAGADLAERFAVADRLTFWIDCTAGAPEGTFSTGPTRRTVK